jgi:hypothetical protein
MDVENVLKSEIFKPIVITLAPGMLALGPYFFVALYFHSNLLVTLKEHEVPALAAAFALIVIAGYMLENLGSRVEHLLWLTYEKSGDLDKWHAYLLSKPDPNQMIGNYIGSIVLRMKLENSLIVAFVVVWLGLTWLYKLSVVAQACTYWSATVFLLLLCLYQLLESRASGMLLRDLRAKL